jgi:hypothetical protein
MNIPFNPSPNFSTPQQAQAHFGEPRTFKRVVLHWWDDPAKNPTLQGVIATFKKTGGTSAHYVVDDKTILNMVKEENIAYHAKNANPSTIGIEINPKTPGDTYKNVIALVADICKRREIAITRQNIIGHREVVNTACPGTIDIDRVVREAKALGTPPPPSADDLYRVTHKGKQLGAFKENPITKIDAYETFLKNVAIGIESLKVKK